MIVNRIKVNSPKEVCRKLWNSATLRAGLTRRHAEEGHEYLGEYLHTYTPHPTHPTPYTLHPTPHTPHPAPCTLHPAPCTPHPTLYTLHPTPCNLHPTPCTLHPTPYTSVLARWAKGAKQRSETVACLVHLTHSVLKSFCKSKFPHKSVDLFLMLVIVKDKLTDF